jgi:hypothetical protein
MRAQIHEYANPRFERRTGLLELPGFEIRRTRARGFALQIWGPLEETWAAALGVGLFEAGMRVVRGYGRRLDGRVWLGEFELEALDDAEDPVGIDYLELAREPVELLAPPLVALARFHRSLTSKHGGSLFLEVRARDRLGFLGGLLAPIARLGLVPEEFHIDTLGLPVLDRFFLKQLDGAAPGREARRRLKGLLAQLSSPRTSAIE